MPTFEEVCRKVINNPQFLYKILIGGLLCFVPPFSLLAFGYLYEQTRQIRHTGQLELPDWDRWDILVASGVRFLLLFLAFFMLPIAVGGLVFRIFDSITFGLFFIVEYLTFALFCLAAPTLFAWGLLRYQLRQQWRDTLAFRHLWPALAPVLPHLLVPTFAFWGLMAATLPLYGFAFFAGMALFLPYATLCLLVQRPRRHR